MNEKPLKLDMDFNEALRRVANTPKRLVVPDKPKKKPAKKKVNKKPA